MPEMDWSVCATSVESLDTLFNDLEQLGAARPPTRCYKREEIANQIQAIVDGGKETGKDVVTKAFLAGQYEEVIGTEFYATTMDGKSTLGKMSFKNWKPLDAVTVIDSSVNNRGEVGSSQEYRTEANFTFTESGMKGKSSLIGSYRLDEEDPSKIIVQFAAVRLGPGSSDPADVKAWKEFLGPHNPTMDEDGFVVTPFEKGPQAWLQFIYMDKDVQCFESQNGTFHMLKRLS
ncbi:unnamed protein product [Ostreobium quekettii]|uniref:Uncharacterized protein n=1 Tax=Ostreobium quekettii TaxID=121088 RepID=A0A8S1JCL2_9CHLO|nr:unnamed protein product [Ostreobium quekettii]